MTTPDATASRTAVSRTAADGRRPGWPEIAAAAIMYALLYFAVPPIIDALTVGDPAASGLAYAALSGVMGILAFLAAFVLRIRRLPAFGIRGVRARWWFIAIGLGIVAVVVVRLLVIGLVAVFGPLPEVQGVYRDAAGSGVAGLVLQLVFIAVLTPLGEEAAFRGVLTNALGRYGAWVAVPVSTIVFALVHGLNLALVPAVVVGVINALLFLRTRSIWPGVVVHAVNNSLSTVLPLLLAGAVAA